jgi:xylose dehydrogenase (NAD/NADP)
MKQVRWGVIGCGQISFDRAMPAITNAPNATLVSVADVSEERLGLARTKFPGIQTYTAYADLLAAEGEHAVDAVYIGLPNQLHHPVAIAAAKAGKHVLCEKPISIDANEALEMANTCYENGVKLMGAYMSRFGDPFREAKRVIQGGTLGQIAMVNANFSFAAWRGYTLDKPGSWRWTGKRGGPLLDAGIYIAFAIRELLGSRVKRVSADIRTVVAKDFPAPDTVVAWFELENGVPGVYTTTYSHGDSYFAVHGTNGSLVMDNAFAQRPSGTVKVRAGHYQLDYNSDISLVDHNENYRREVEHFSDAILNGTPHSPSAQEALEDMTLLDAIEESAKQGRIVELEYATVKG